MQSFSSAYGAVVSTAPCGPMTSKEGKSLSGQGMTVGVTLSEHDALPVAVMLGVTAEDRVNEARTEELPL